MADELEYASISPTAAAVAAGRRRRRRPPSSFREIPININNSDADRREERPRGVVNCELIK